VVEGLEAGRAVEEAVKVMEEEGTGREEVEGVVKAEVLERQSGK
jgi:hypothetical protein